ncbi:hypothetical protein GPECTOR_55g286 [Gonium pectorale]|uniref:Uncharacterized protein n=1 Tax=Gonium pectorale TaxID=33097 RepID=A0A150G7Q8_GONPE|nr:hypothetical protein GPECTOR_55g286 [Gonium pectorale]|eukprot:KXZ45380.1 hypothetical protein GPECTOR_55g286 [Gonium pectorale]
MAGYWSRPLLGPAGASPYALVHFYHTPGGAHNKLTVKMANSVWNWDLQHRLRPHGGVFFASAPHAPVPDVLSYAPGVEEREWASYEEWDAATKAGRGGWGRLAALARLAMEMGRAAAFPAPRCNVSWLGGNRTNQLPLDIDRKHMVGVGAAWRVGGHQNWLIPTVRPSPGPGGGGRGGGFSGLRCMLGGYLMQGCLAVRWYHSGGLLAPEYDHFLDHFIRGKGEPSAAVPAAALAPPAGAAAWDVGALAASLMAAHGGPGSGLRHPRFLERDRAAAAAAAAASGPRPRLLLLPAVPALTGKLGPREALYREREVEDFNKMSCPWIQNKPFS